MRILKIKDAKDRKRAIASVWYRSLLNWVVAGAQERGAVAVQFVMKGYRARDGRFTPQVIFLSDVHEL